MAKSEKGKTANPPAPAKVSSRRRKIRGASGDVTAAAVATSKKRKSEGAGAVDEGGVQDQDGSMRKRKQKSKEVEPTSEGLEAGDAKGIQDQEPTTRKRKKRKSKEEVEATSDGVEAGDAKGIQDQDPPMKKRKKSKSKKGDAEGVQDQDMRKRKRKSKKSKVKKVEAGDGKGVHDPSDGVGGGAGGTPGANATIIVNSVKEYLEKTAIFAPGSALVSLGSDSSLTEAWVFWQFISARRVRNGRCFQLSNMETFLHKARALTYVNGQIDGLADWHNALTLRIDSLEHEIGVVLKSLKDACPPRPNTSQSSRWPLGEMEFFLDTDSEVLSAAVKSASDLKRKFDLTQEEITALKQSKNIPLLAPSFYTSSSPCPFQGHAPKEESPLPIAQGEVRHLVKKVLEIQRNGLKSLQRILFDGVMELRKDVSGTTYLGSGPTNYQEFPA